MDNLDTAFDKAASDVASSPAQKSPPDIDALTAGHQYWIQVFNNKFDVLTHKLVFLVLLLAVSALFLAARYLIAARDESLFKQLYSDTKTVLKGAGVSFVTFLVPQGHSFCLLALSNTLP